MSNLTRISRQVVYGAGLSNAGFTLSGFNSLAAGSFVLASTAYSNTGVVDPYWELSFALTVGGTTVAGDFIALYGLPLNQDASTYGDGVASGATLPAPGYLLGQIGIKAGVTNGNVITGSILFRMPFQDVKLAVANRLTVALAASAAAAMSLSSARDDLNS